MKLPADGNLENRKCAKTRKQENTSYLNRLLNLSSRLRIQEKAKKSFSFVTIIV